MALYFLSMTQGSLAIGPGTLAGVSESGATVAAAVVNVEINTTIAPTIGRADVVQMLRSCINYILADGNLASPVLVLLP